MRINLRNADLYVRHVLHCDALQLIRSTYSLHCMYTVQQLCMCRTAKKALLCAALSLGALALQHSSSSNNSSGNSTTSSSSSSFSAAHKFAVTARAHLKEVFDVPSTLTASEHSFTYVAQ
jgi:hypothetical protein